MLRVPPHEGGIMMRLLRRRVAVGLRLSAFSFLVFASSGPSRLNAIKNIYLGDFGSGEGADLVREKVRVLLSKSDRFAVVKVAETADGILTGSAGADRTYNRDGTSLHGYRVLRLVERKSQQAIWFFE